MPPYAMLRVMSDATTDTAAQAPDGGNGIPGPRLRRLKINKFRNVRPTELVFDDEWNVLLGKNGTGKTTLLELIAATIRGDLKAFDNVEYDLEAELSFGAVDIKWKVGTSGPSNVPQQVQMSLPGIVHSTQRRFHAEILGEGLDNCVLEGDERGIDGYHGTVVMSPAGGSAPFFLMLALCADGSTPLGPRFGLAWDAASYSGDVQRFDEILTFFQRISPNGELTLSTLVSQWSLVSTELNRACGRSLQSADERISIDHQELPFLRRFVELCNFSGASMHLELLQRDASGKAPHAVYGRPSFLFRRHNGEELREQHLSFGQKRLLSFLYYITLSNPIVADELVDGLHYDWIEACVDECRGRQKFFASQNPLLVDHMGFKSREAVKSRFIRCSLDGDEMVWQNFTDEEADDFFVAYRTGIQAVSEVLRQKGLW